MTRCRQCRSSLCAVVLAAVGAAAAGVAQEALPPRDGEANQTTVPRKLYTGRVVRLSEALQRRGIASGPETAGHMVLETEGGKLIPILADWRGRAFYQDPRLRDRRVALVATRRDDIGYLQPLMVFTYDDAGRPQFTDYWCDVCSIPMYEIKPCECCQGEIRLRYTLQAPPADVPPAEE